jgi:hypothetical protein
MPVLLACVSVLLLARPVARSGPPAFGEPRLPEPGQAWAMPLATGQVRAADSAAAPAGAALKPAPRASAAQLKGNPALLNQLRNAVDGLRR